MQAESAQRVAALSPHQILPRQRQLCTTQQRQLQNMYDRYCPSDEPQLI